MIDTGSERTEAVDLTRIQFGFTLRCAMSTNRNETIRLWDRLGILFSGLCVIHCLLVPVLLVLVPSFGAFWLAGEDSTHRLIFLGILVTAAVAFLFGYRMHRSLVPMIWMAFGMLFVVLGTFLNKSVMGYWGEYVLVPMGGLILIRAHFLNRFHCRTCHEHHDCPTWGREMSLTKDHHN